MNIPTPTAVTLSCIGLLFSILMSLHSPQTVAQEQDEFRYISDVLFVPLRSGQGSQYRIINKGLKSATKLIFIEDGDSGEWTKVRTESGIEGWIRNQYLMEEEPSRIKLNRALSRLAALDKKQQQVVSENKQLQQANNELSSTASSSTEKSQGLASELEKIKTLSAGAIDLDKRYNELLQKHQLIQTENNVLKAENEKLVNDNRVTYMMYGVGILLLGIFLAYLLPLLKPKRNHSEWR
ncbi:TIGR04211 family SH3 domain-containing protein [Teredinibacter haidensis]|uniref:TIGR04211 family SH3 domain-containing protein n=1 Tax=Teredinibacter haidensis TaxID=2731755 RepID=UPI000949046A|nr:TIGR04211 family SH3 domain-containing protein [Teredinibacter haidensis]